MTAPKNPTERTPPGQTLTEKWPVLHYADVPRISKESFRFKIFGLVDNPIELSWEELTALPKVTLTADFHCVTTWSRLDNVWEGIHYRTLRDLVKPKATAKSSMIHGFDGYTTNVPLNWLDDDDVLFAWSHDGAALTAEHGGPLRLIVPKLYAWKSAKWVSGVEYTPVDRRGFWEERGYHKRGEPFAEERFSYQESAQEND